MSSQKLLNFDWRVVNVIGSDTVSNIPGTSSGSNGLPILQLLLSVSDEQNASIAPSSYTQVVTEVDGEQVMPTSSMLVELQLQQLDELIVCLHGANQTLMEVEKGEETA
jgi:hypothetical protein